MQSQVKLLPVDSVEATVVVDNSIDILLPSDARALRAPLPEALSRGPQLVAEHGFSLLLTLESRGTRRAILYDAGLTPYALGHNLQVLGLRLEEVEGLVLSHGHADHHGGLEGVARELGRRHLPLILHPDAWHERRLAFPSGAVMRLPPPDRRMLDQHEFEVLDREEPSYVLADQALITGRVPRVTEFERGLPSQQRQVGDRWEPDPWTWDDQGIICNLKGRGLVVVSACSHAGVINVLKNAQRLTGISRIHAFVGGLHLTGGLFEPIIPRTIDALRTLAPDFVVPGHCTGWKAAHAISSSLPSAYIQTSVGTRLHFS